MVELQSTNTIVVFAWKLAGTFLEKNMPSVTCNLSLGLYILSDSYHYVITINIINQRKKKNTKAKLVNSSYNTCLCCFGLHLDLIR